jgi:hypothetical protein
MANLIESKMVRPQTAREQGAENTWKFTSADRLTMENGFALGTCWVFKQAIPSSVIESSLSRLLDEYRPFAGRYDEWNKCVRVNDAGVKYQILQDDEFDISRVELEHHTEHFTKKFIDDSSSIIGYRLLNAPLMTVRLTYLRNGEGCVLGVRATHGLCDGDTFYTMMDRWAKLARGTSEAASAVFDQSQVPFDPNRRTFEEVIEAVEEQGWSYISKPPAVARLAVLLKDGVGLQHRKRTSRYHISTEALRRVKFAAELDCKLAGRNISSSITTNEALCSFLCQILARVFDFDDSTPCGHSTMFNWRGRLDGMSPKFAGNASSAIKTCDFFAGSPLGEIAFKMNQGLEVFKKDQKVVQEHVELFLDTHHVGLASHMSDPRTLPYLTPKPTSAVTNNFGRYPIYGVDFGYGRPTLVVPHHCGDQVIIWPSADGDGVDLYFQGTTALTIQALSMEEQEWFHEELSKFDHLDEQVIREWFESRMTNKKDTSATKSPLLVSKKPTKAMTPTQGLIKAFTQGVLYPMATLMGL